MEWLDSHPNEEASTYEEKQKEVEGVANEVMQKLYSQGAGSPGGMPGGMPGEMPNMEEMMRQAQAGTAGTTGAETSSAPTVEEVD